MCSSDLNNYMFVPIQFVYIVCALGFLLFLYMTAHNKIKISGKVLIYAGYVVLFSLIASIFTPDFSLYLLLVRMGYFLLVFVNFYIFAYQIWDFERCFKLYRNLCYFLSALIIIQFVLGQVGAGVSLIPPDMTTNTAEFTSSNVYRLNQVLDRRFSTFFLHTIDRLAIPHCMESCCMKHLNFDIDIITVLFYCIVCYYNRCSGVGCCINI